MLEMRIEFKDLMEKNVKMEILDLLELNELKRLSNCCSSIISKGDGDKKKIDKIEYCKLIGERIDVNIEKLGGKIKKNLKVVNENSIEDVNKGLNNVRSKLSIGRSKGISEENLKDLIIEEKRLVKVRDSLKGNKVENVIDKKINELRNLMVDGEDNKDLESMIKLLEGCK